MKIRRLTAMILAIVTILGLTAITDVSATAPIITHYFEPVDGEVITVSVDVKQTGEGIYGVEFSSPKNINTPYDTANLTPYGMMRFYDGQLFFRTNGGWIAPNQLTQSGINTTKFTENEWHNIKLRVTRKDRLAELYLDEEYVGSMNLLNELVNPAHLVRVFSQGEKNFEMNFVSVTASEIGAVSAAIDNIDFENKQISIMFSESIQNAGALDDAIMNAVNCYEGNQSVDLAVIESQGSQITFGYEDELKLSNEYAIIFPEGIMGKNGGILKNRYLYFTTVNATTLQLEDGCDYNDGVAKFWVDQPNGVNLLADAGDEYGNVLYIRARKNDVDNLPVYGFTPPTEDISSISFDIQPRRDNLQAALEIWSPSASTYPISIVFGKTGYILCKRDSWTDIEWYIQPNDEENIYINDVIGTFKAKEWINFRVTFDKISKTAWIYINDELVMTLDEAKMSGFEQFSHLRYILPAQGNVRTPLLYMDNVKGEVEKKLPSIEKTRFNSAMGDVNGGAETISRLISSVDVTFTSEMDEDTLNLTTVKLLYDGEEVGYTGEYDESENVYRLFPEIVPYENAEISLAVDGATDVNGVEILPYLLSTVSDTTTDGLQVFDVGYVDSEGERISELTNGEIYVRTVVANLTDEDREILVSAMGYENSALRKYEYFVDIVKANSLCIIDPEQNSVHFNSNVIDNTMITLQDAETKIPLVGTYEISRADYEAKEGEIKLSGEAYGEVAIEVYAPDKTFDDIEYATDFRDVLLYKTQFLAKGEFECDFNINYSNAVSEMYTVNIVNEDIADSYRILYVNKDNAEDVFNLQLKPAIDEKDEAEIAKVLLENKFDLYIDDRYIDEEISERAAQLILSSGVSFETAETVLNKAVAVAAFEQGKIADILEEDKIFDLSNSSIADLYKSSFVRKATVEDIVSRMKSKKYASVKEFEECLRDAFILAVVNNPTEPSCVKTVLNAFGISAKKDKYYNEISGKNYKDIDSLKKALKNAADSDTTNGGGSSSGGGGSFGGGRGGSGKVENLAIQIDTKESVNEQVYFDDVSNVEWAKEAINSLAEKNIVNGKADGKFLPNDNITREEFTKILVLALGIEGDAVLDFADTKEDMWYFEFIRRAFGAGVVKGYNDEYFGVGNLITRQDMAVMIYRGAVKAGKKLGNSYGGTEFVDDQYIQNYARDAVYVLKNSNVIAGKDNGRFEPEAFATRAEAAKMIYNILNK